MKKIFLEHFSQCGNITTACAAAGGISRRSIYRWQEHDQAFAAAYREADVQATERLEREAWRRAVEGTPYKRTSYWHGEPVGTDERLQYSDALLILLLRARKPDTYRENVNVAIGQVIKTVVGVDPQSVL